MKKGAKMENLNAEVCEICGCMYVVGKPHICHKENSYVPKLNLPRELAREISLKNTIALINSQEQRIGELTEQLEAMRGAAEAWKEHSKTLEGENVKLKKLVDDGFDTENALNEKVKELTEDVERVAKQCGEIIVECDERDAERLNQVGKLTEENERLRKHNITLEQKLMLLGIDDVYVFKAKMKGE
jgi:regulator of replication initiation timing